MLLGLSVSLVSSTVFGEPKHNNVELTPLIGMVQRGAEGPQKVVKYDPGLAVGGQIKLPIVNWLQFAMYYLRVFQGVGVADGALERGAPVSVDGHLSSYVIGGRLEPTWHVTERLRLWVSAGGGWGKISTPRLQVHAPSPYTVEPQEAVFVEIPLGVGGDFEIIPHWMSFAIDAAVGPVLAQGGQLGPRSGAQAVTAEGRLVYPPLIPELSSSWTLVAGISLHL